MRITELPQATSVAQTDDLAIDVPGGRTYKVPRSVLAPAPYVVTIPTGQWSGSGSDRYITISASNVTADAMLYPFYDNASGSLLKGPVWTIPANGSFTIHTTSIPAGTVTISVLFAGILGEAQYQVLADVYSKSQTYSKTETDSAIAQSTASCTQTTFTNFTLAASARTFVYPTAPTVPQGHSAYLVAAQLSINSSGVIFQGVSPSSRSALFYNTISSALSGSDFPLYCTWIILPTA